MITLLDKINECYFENPSKICCQSLEFDNGKINTISLTYKELVEKSLAIKNYIQYQSKSAKPILISIENPLNFLIVFVGILSAKNIAVPVPYFSHLKSTKPLAQRILGICQDCNPTLIITDNFEKWQEIYNADIMPKLFCITENDLGIVEENICLPSVRLEQTAYLQYTSGSTGQPKGVVVTHHNMISNIIACGEAASYTNKDIFVSWLPLYHDMGLLGGLLMPLYWKIDLYLFTPTQFISRPVYWLLAIHHFRATITMGPTFAYHLIGNYVSETTLAQLDLSCLRLAYIGAEPIPLRIIKQFNERLKISRLNPYSIYPCYGLAEATLGVSCPPVNRELVIDYIDRISLICHNKIIPMEDKEKSIAFISVGKALPGHEIYIINPKSNELCKEREIGEIIVKGPSVSSGYYHEKTKKEFLKTGDLGYMASHELYIIDRIKDIVIINGQNFYSMDIENCLNKLPELKNSKAVPFTHLNENKLEELHIVVEVKKSSLKNNSTENSDLIKNIRAIIQEEFNITPKKIVIVPRGSLARTSSGKIMRNACREQFTTDKSF